MRQGSKESSYFPDQRESPRITPREGLRTVLLTGLGGEKMMMVLSTTLPGHNVPNHSHRNEQVGMVYAGRAILQIGNERRTVKKGDFYRIPANVSHGDTCIGPKPFVMLDIFYPVRKDFVEDLRRTLPGRQSNRPRLGGRTLQL